jgi:hypothetical protein
MESSTDSRATLLTFGHGTAGRDALALWLPEEGIGYRWEQRLGGFRKAAGDSPDVFWELLDQAARVRTAVTCTGRRRARDSATMACSSTTASLR